MQKSATMFFVSPGFPSRAAQEVLPEEAGFDSVAAGLDSAAGFDSPAFELESAPDLAGPESALALSELDPPEGFAA